MVLHELNDVAALAARQAVIEGTSTTQITATAADYLLKLGIIGASTTVLVNGVATEAATAKQNDQMTVSISVPASKITWLPGGGYLAGATLTGQCTLRRE